MEEFTPNYFQSHLNFVLKIRAARADVIMARSNGFIKLFQ